MKTPMEFTKMERKFFEAEIANLSLNFRQKLDMKTVDFYWQHLSRYSKERFGKSVKSIVNNEEYFPSVAVFKKYLDIEPEPTRELFPEWKDIKASPGSQIAQKCIEVISKLLNQKISLAGYCDELDKMGINTESLRTRIRDHQTKSEGVCKVLAGEEAQVFEKKREEAKFKIRYRE